MNELQITNEALVGILGLVIGGGVGMISVIASSLSTKKTLQNQLYADLDLMYQDILKIGLENPSFRDKYKTMNYKNIFEGEELIRYKTYAEMVWNFCEAVYDKADHDEMNKKTWNHVIIMEKERHLTWFEEEETKENYKDEFREYVMSLKRKRKN